MRRRLPSLRRVPFAALLLWSVALPAQERARAARPSPDWLRDGVVYELFPRAFSPEGTFDAITARLPELQRLGVTVVWLMPIHPIGAAKRKGTVGSPYAVRDFRAVNPDYGTPDDLRRLVRAAHALGLKVIIDLVANHTAWDNVLMRTPSWYERDGAGRILSPYDWTDVAALDYANPAVRQYMRETMVQWVRDYDLDGFRCDVAGEVPVDFWEEARRAVEAVKPDVMLLAEAHEPALLREAFDVDYAWPLYHAMKDALLGVRPATAIREAWEAERAAYPAGALHLRIADNHDERRAITFFGERGALAASALVFTLDGVPMLYNGMEVGDATESMAPALFERLPIFWGIRARRPEFPAFYAAMVPLRRALPALRRGAVRWVASSDERRVVTFVRHEAGEEVLVAINLSNQPFTGTVEVGGAGWVERTPGAAREVALPALALGPWEWRLFRRGP